MDKDIYSFLNPDSNDILSKLKLNDLKELKRLLNTFMLSYREKIGLSKKVTFGPEIEFEVSEESLGDIWEEIKEELFLKFNSWNINFDTSANDKLEITPYILKDNKKTWVELKKILDIIKNYTNIPGPYSSSHIHFGGQMIKNTDALKRFIKLWCIYEPIIFRFGYGEDLTHRKEIDTFATKISTVLSLLKKDVNLSVISTGRYRAVNIRNYKGSFFNEYNTIEIRCPNGTLEPVIWQNNINFFARLLEFANSDKCDDEEIDKIYYNLDLNKLNYKKYDTLNFKLAIELADKIFSTNEEKLYFLRQYTKGFETVSKKQKVATSFILKQ